MLSDEQRAYLARATLTMQIIVGALAAGVILFGGIVLALRPLQGGAPLDGSLLTYMAAGAAFMALVAAMVIPSVLLRSQRQAIVAGTSTLVAGSIGGEPLPEAHRELGPLVAVYQTCLIIRSAILEGAAFFALVAYQLEQQPLSLAAAGMLLLFLLAKFPTRSKVEDAIESERTTIAQLRQMS
jgi:hypothetical protein